MSYTVYAHTLEDETLMPISVSVEMIDTIANYLACNCLRSNPEIDYNEMQINVKFPTYNSMKHHMQILESMFPSLQYNVWKQCETELDMWCFPALVD